MYVSGYPLRPGEGTGFPGTGVLGGYEPHHVSAGLDLNLLQEQEALGQQSFLTKNHRSTSLSPFIQHWGWTQSSVRARGAF